MKKINNRGFAISTMLYGLLIIMVLMMALLMSTLAFTRNNSKKFVNEVVDELQKRQLGMKLKEITLYGDETKKLSKVYAKTDESYWVIVESTGYKGGIKKKSNISGSTVVGTVTTTTTSGLNPNNSNLTYDAITASNPGNSNTSFRIRVDSPKNISLANLTITINAGVFEAFNDDSITNKEIKIDVGEISEDKFNVVSSAKSLYEGGKVYELTLKLKRESTLPIKPSILDYLSKNAWCSWNNGLESKNIIDSNKQDDQFLRDDSLVFLTHPVERYTYTYTVARAGIKCTLPETEGFSKQEIDTGWEFCNAGETNGTKIDKCCRWWMQPLNSTCS